MAYGMLAKGGYEFTDVESAEFFDMLNAPGEDLSDDELAFMLKDVEIAPEDGGDETWSGCFPYCSFALVYQSRKETLKLLQCTTVLSNSKPVLTGTASKI